MLANRESVPVRPLPRTPLRLVAVVAVIAGLVAVVGPASPTAAAPGIGPDVRTALPDVLWPEMVLDSDDNPVLAFETADEQLALMRCTDPDCSGPKTTTVPDPRMFVGDIDLELAPNGNPVIAYAVQAELTVLACTNPTCSGTQAPVHPDPGGERYPSLGINGAGNPVLSYNAAGDTVGLMVCTNPTCAGTQTATYPATVDGEGAFSTLALDASERPVIAFNNSLTGSVNVMRCTNTTCTGPQTATSIASLTDPDQPWPIELDANDQPIVTYYYEPTGDLRVVHCQTPDCSDTPAPATPDTESTVGAQPAMTLDASGNPVIAYRDVTHGTLRILRCTNLGCTGTQTPYVADNGPNAGGGSAVAIDSKDNVVVVYGSQGVIQLLHCYDATTCGGQDQDGDGVAHSVDNCPTVANPDQANTNGGQTGDACDDEDLDGLLDGADNCVAVPNVDQADLDGDGLGDACDLDVDGDGVTDAEDNCLRTANADQFDFDGDGAGYACDVGDPALPKACAANVTYNLIVGTMGADVLIGTSGPDFILGLAGDDIIKSRGGNDCILGGKGNDTINAGAGHDYANGQGGDDRLRGKAGSDKLVGNNGADRIWGNKGADTLIGGKKADVLKGGSGPDIINSGSGRDVTRGGSGIDRCQGKTKTDTQHSCET